MRFLFYKREFAWPRQSGHDVHTFSMMRALGGLGATVGLVTLRTPPVEALAGLHLEALVPLDRARAQPPVLTGQLTPLQNRFASYWGLSNRDVAAFLAEARAFEADVVVAAGMEVLPLLVQVDSGVRVWYAADELCWQQLSLVQLGSPSSWRNLRDGPLLGLYERAFRTKIDRVWVVSDWEGRRMRWIAGIRNVDVLPNGVDSSFYAPTAEPGEADSAVFWGRLDFGPNIRALQWFCERVWPDVIRVRPTARFTILGFKPSSAVSTLARLRGVTVRANLEDIRPEVARHALVVLPFTSGGGIKNKLLEAAAMGKPIVCSRKALAGLKGDPPLTVPNGPVAWREALFRLWDDQRERRTLGTKAREWVTREHTWESTARLAMHALAQVS